MNEQIEGGIGMKTNWQVGDKFRLLDVSNIVCGMQRKNGDVLTVEGTFHGGGQPYSECGLVINEHELPYIEKVTEATTKTTTRGRRIMTNKLTVTLGQSIALGIYIKEKGKSMESFVLNRHLWSNRFGPIKHFTLEEMTTALYVGYEQEVIERGFEVGDWVTTANPEMKLSRSQDIKVAQVVAVDGYIELKNLQGIFTADYLRLATPNEIFWAKLGRGTNELRYGDVIVIGNSVMYRITEGAYFDDELTMEAAGEDLGAGRIRKLYPAETMLDMPKVK